MRVGIGQINATVGAIDHNVEAICAAVRKARSAGCDLTVFPELAIPGYAPLDLLWRRGFVDACRAGLDRIQAEAGPMTVVVGSVAAESTRVPVNRADTSSVSDGASTDLYNVAVLLRKGREVGRVQKIHLPTYDVYHERRYFTPGPGSELHTIGGRKFGVNICEDIWVDDGPTDLQASLGAEWILNLSASPFYVGKPGIRRKLIRRRSVENGVGIVYVNLVGAQDDVIFDGGSFVTNAAGEILFEAPRFEDDLYAVDLDGTGVRVPNDDPVAQTRGAIVLGIRDYVRKNARADVLLGLSGGVDSAVVAALAVEALGAEHVSTVYLPSEFSSAESREDSAAVARNLGIDYTEIPIDPIHDALRQALPARADGLVDENLQPRARGTLLMALSNQRGALVLCPANKSEIAVGYNTLYGDTVGALAPIADLYKDDVYRLAKSFGAVIPERILRKAPTAELRPNQRDDDDLPPYATLDPLLRAIIEKNESRSELLAAGFDPALVDDVLGRYYRNEYKRHQLPIGIKVTPKAFGSGRRIPITNGYRD
ncbi:MAG: NAD+ synthase [Candidatus Bipolaricaulota bacterium]|nr:NAD+ synthase [Candidatus Bipolaricaulota bacterium]